jgi:hypothetical protein
MLVKKEEQKKLEHKLIIIKQIVTFHAWALTWITPF